MFGGFRAAALLLQADMGRVPVLGSRAEYERMYERSLAEPAQFWADMTKSLGLIFKQQVANSHHHASPHSLRIASSATPAAPAKVSQSLTALVTEL